MKNILSGFVLCAFVLTGGSSQAVAGMAADDAVRVAKEYAQQQGLSLEPYREPRAVFVESEGVWIVHFSDKRDFPPPDSDFMIKIQAETARSLGFLGGAGKEGYYPYFKGQDAQ